MSTNNSPSIVTDNLIVYYDFANTNCYRDYNLFQYTEQFDNAAWAKNSTIISANTITAPDGTLSADKHIEDTTNANHDLYMGVPISNNTTYNVSVYAKAGERNLFRIGFLSSYFNGAVYFDLNAGVVTSNAGAATGSIEYVGNGWYRCNASATSFSGGTSNFYFCPIISGTTSTYTGDGTSGFYLWGAQITQGSNPQPYQKVVTHPTIIVDLNTSSKKYNGTFQGTGIYPIGDGKGSLYFKSSTLSYINISNTPSDFFPLPNFSFDVWFKCSSVAAIGNSGFISLTYDVFLDINNSGVIKLNMVNHSLSANTAVAANGNYLDGIWHNVVATNDMFTTNFYIDGVLNVSGSQIGQGTTASAAQSVIGLNSNNVNRVFEGNIANVKVYTKVLSASEVQQNYNALKGRYV